MEYKKNGSKNLVSLGNILKCNNLGFKDIGEFGSVHVDQQLTHATLG